MADMVLILFVIAYGILSVLILWNIAGFFKYFQRDTQMFVSQMNRAERPEDYRYWHKKLRCHYLSLIPFVNHRNVEKVYSFFFHRQKNAKGEKRSAGIFHILAPSAVGVCLCAVCLCGMSWAWFTASTTSDAQTIKTPQYTISPAVYQGETEQIGTTSANGSTEYTLSDGTYTVTLTTVGTENATGYCIVKAGGATYYTEQIPANGTFSFSVQASGTVSVIFTPAWGSSAARTSTNQILTGAVLQAEGPSSDSAIDQTQDKTPEASSDTNGVAPSGTNAVSPSQTGTQPVLEEPVTTAAEPESPVSQKNGEETTATLPKETSPAEESSQGETTAEETTAALPTQTDAPEESDTLPGA